MKLKKGAEVIDFNTEDVLSKVIDLKNYRGKKLLLSFYRGASCPFCNLSVHEVVRYTDVFKQKNLEVIGFFMSEKQEILEYAGKQNPSFPIISDPNKKFYTLYGLEESLSGKIKAMFRMGAMMKIFAKGFFSIKSMKDYNTLPADFLINEHGILEQAYYGKDFGDHHDFKIINN